MLLLYYIILLILELSTLFSVLHNHVTCDCDLCDYHTSHHITLLHLSLKIKKKKKKLKKVKENEKI